MALNIRKHPRNGKATIIVLAVLVVVALGVLLLGRSPGYGPVSKQAYQCAMATLQACLSRSEQRVDHVSRFMDDQSNVSEMTDQELSWLRDILQAAKDGNWETATRSARRMMEDQVKY